jgi:glutathione peroxidase
MQNLHSFEAKLLTGEQISLSQYANKTVLLVNTASKCGLVRQLGQLESLYRQYAPGGLVVLGFPSADFLGQEFAAGEDIGRFCQRNYGVSFPMFMPVHVRGKNKHPVFKYVADKKLNGKFSVPPLWNFQKYLFDGKGELVDFWFPFTSPQAPKVKKRIESLLTKTVAV